MSNPWVRGIIGVVGIVSIYAVLLYGAVTWLPVFIAENQ